MSFTTTHDSDRAIQMRRKFEPMEGHAMTIERVQMSGLTEVADWLQRWQPRPDESAFLSEVSLAKAVAAGRLIWPEFVEYRGGVFLISRFAEANVDQWWLSLDGELSGIEMMVNHTHLWEIFAVPTEGFSEEEERALLELASVMQQSWAAALSLAFPNREFEVFMDDGPDEYGPTVTFCTVSGSRHESKLAT